MNGQDWFAASLGGGLWAVKKRGDGGVVIVASPFHSKAEAEEWITQNRPSQV